MYSAMPYVRAISKTLVLTLFIYLGLIFIYFGYRYMRYSAFGGPLLTDYQIMTINAVVIFFLILVFFLREARTELV